MFKGHGFLFFTQFILHKCVDIGISWSVYFSKYSSDILLFWYNKLRIRGCVCVRVPVCMYASRVLIEKAGMHWGE